MYRLQVHSALSQLAISMSAIFSAAYLLKMGLTPGQVFISYAAIFVLRALFRPVIIPMMPVLGMRKMLIAGTVLIAGQYGAIAFVTGVDWTLYAYIGFTAFSNMLYWTVYHPVFAAAGEFHDRGKQLGARQAITALTGIFGPLLSGLLLNYVGAWAAFGAATIVSLVSIWPILGIRDYPVATTTPPGTLRAAIPCALLFLSDGFLWLCAGMAWSMLLFERFNERFDAFGFVLALAAVAAAVASFTVGRKIDLGHGRSAAITAAVIGIVVYVMRATVGTNVWAILAVVAASTVLIHFATATMMTAYYNEAKKAPCVFRLQCIAETGWDTGAVLGSLAGAAIVYWGFPLQSVIWLAMISVLSEAALLYAIYGKSNG
jgi:MFS family permease